MVDLNSHGGPHTHGGPHIHGGHHIHGGPHPQECYPYYA